MVVEVAWRPDHNELMASISGMVDESKVKITAGSKKLAEIKGLGKDTGEEEVQEMVNRCLGAGHGTRVAWIWNYGLELRIAIIEGTKDSIKKVIEQRWITVGLTRCRVQERSDRLQRCRKCWHSGHIASECKGIDRRGLL